MVIGQPYCYFATLPFGMKAFYVLVFVRDSQPISYDLPLNSSNIRGIGVTASVACKIGRMVRNVHFEMGRPVFDQFVCLCSSLFYKA